MSEEKQTKVPGAAELLEMANVQIAAEAFLAGKGDKGASPGNLPYKKITLKNEILTEGNTHTSRFSKIGAEDFIKKWEVISYMPTTATGFSGTLFKARKAIEGTDIKAGDLVMSFRSTEFIDDAARDNQATNKMEIADKGWAFGQIDDMEKWFEYLKDNNIIGSGEKIRLTGYSLGGHLATAFNILHQHDDLIAATYTFNGAGVGKKTGNTEMDAGTLRKIILEFRQNREKGAGKELLKTK